MRRVLAAMLLLLAPGSVLAETQAYPSKVVKLIVPFTPGSPVDGLARIAAHHMQARLGQSVIIENRPGAGTTIGTKAVATSSPDGHTLLLIGPNVVYSQVLYPNFDFDPARSLTPVGTLVTWSHVMVVAPNVPARTIAELVAYATANPGKLAFGFGLGTTPHVLGETFKRATGIEIVSVPYRGGEQARADLLGGRIHINIAPVPSLMPLILEGKARPLAFTGPRRSPDLLDVPTMAESGFPQVGFDPDVWLGILAPTNTPAAAISRLNREINDSLKSPEMIAILAKLGYETKVTTPAEFADFLEAERRKWPPLLKAAGLKPE